MNCFNDVKISDTVNEGSIYICKTYLCCHL